MHVVQRMPRRQVGYGRRMYSPPQRGLVRNSINYRYGQDGLEGMFNIGKMFTRMFTFTPSSFKLKNIAGAIGSVTSTIATGGIANIASEIAGPSGLKLTKGTVTGAHSKPMQYVGYGTMAAAAAAGLYFGGGAVISAVKGAGGVAASTSGMTSAGVGAGAGGTFAGGTAASTVASTGTGFMGTVGTVFSNIGSGLMTGLKAIGSVLPVLGGAMGGGGGQQQQQGGMTQEEYDAQVLAQQQQQAAYEAQVKAQQAALYNPGGQPISYVPETGQGGWFSQQPGQPSMNNSYGDLRSPYTAITEDGQQVQIDPTTGQVIQPGMSTEVMIGVAALALVGGIYFMSGNNKTN